LRQILRAHRLIPFETTGGNDHAVARLDVQAQTVATDPRTADPVADNQQLFQPTVEPQRFAAILQRTAQGADQGIAQGQVAIALRQTPALAVAPVTPHDLQRQAQPAGATAQQDLRLFHGHRHAPHHQCAGGWRTHAQEFFTQLGGVERLRVHGAITGLAAFDFRVVIGVTRLGLEAHAGLLFEVFDHCLAVLDVGFDAPVVDLAVGHRADIGNRFGGAVTAAQGCDPVVAGNPDPAAGHRRGAAVLVALFDQQHVQSQVVSAQRRGHPACSGTHHQHIAALIPFDLGSFHAITLAQRLQGKNRRPDLRPAQSVSGLLGACAGWSSSDGTKECSSCPCANRPVQIA